MRGTGLSSPAALPTNFPHSSLSLGDPRALFPELKKQKPFLSQGLDSRQRKAAQKHLQTFRRFYCSHAPEENMPDCRGVPDSDAPGPEEAYYTRALAQHFLFLREEGSAKKPKS